jgi:phospholipid-binding lipoprotein MlaA
MNTLDTTFRKFALCAAFVLALGTMSACSTMPAEHAGAEDALDNDPLEPLNRGIYTFNTYADHLVLRPVAAVYRGVVPEEGRKMVSNFIENVNAPVDLANSALQGDAYNSFATFWRFLINTTFGIGGLFDAASEIGLTARHADFGETLAFYGADTGAYLVLPFVGPSNIRDGIGKGVDSLLQPVNWYDEGASLALAISKGVDYRANNMEMIDGFYRDSLDPYAAFRSAFLQKRNADIRKAKKARDASVAKSKAEAAAQ